MNYSHEVERMCPIAKGPHHGPAPIPEEGRWVKAYQISDTVSYTHLDVYKRQAPALHAGGQEFDPPHLHQRVRV